jgi:peptidoglycan-N-acetylglucosamine deacetylase
MRRRNLGTGVLLCLALPALAYQPGKFYYQGHTKEKVIALTFDDGPGPFTPRILDLLKHYNCRATFFMLGDQLPTYAAIAKEVADAGHEVANHTYSHTNFNTLKTADSAKFLHELLETQGLIFKATGKQTVAVRMPHGAFGKYNRAWLLPTLKEHGYALVHWTFGTDWFLKKTPEQMANDYMQNAHPGAVFLFHDGGKHREKTLAALQIVIPELQKKGYRFVAAEELFKE